MKIIYGPAGLKITGRGIGHVTRFGIVETPLQTDPIITTETIDDINFEISTSASSFNNALIVNEGNLELGELDIVSLNPEYAIIQNGNEIIYVSDGTAKFEIQQNGLAKVKYTREMSGDGSTVTYNALSYVAGTLGAHIQEQVDAVLLGKTAGHASQNYIASRGGTWDNPTITMNPDFFIPASFNFTGFSVTRSDQTDDRYPIVLISPRHALIATHVDGNVGTGYTFRRTNGTFQTVTVTELTHFLNVDGEPDEYLDLSLVYLNADVTGVPFYKTIAKGDVEKYAPTLFKSEILQNYIGAIPTFRKAMHYSDGVWGSAIQVSILSDDVQHTLNPFLIAHNMTNAIFPNNQASAKYAEWGYTKSIGGDSGSPSFLLINSDLILITSQFSISSAVDISQLTTEINDEMNVQAGTAPGTYALTHPDLSEFTAFP